MSAELVPITDPDQIANLPAEQRGQLITNALVESKKWLQVATKGTDPTPIQEFKAWAATVAEMTRQKGLSQEIQMDAQEMVRRAERGIGLVVQQGQEAGVVRRPNDHDVTVNRHGPSPSRNVDRTSPLDFYGNRREYVDARDMTVGVSDEDFEDALAEARADGNLARRSVANLARERSGREVVPRDTQPDRATTGRKRPQLPKQFNSACSDLLKASRRLDELSTDKRLSVNREAVRDVCDRQVRHVIEVLTRVLDVLESDSDGGS